MQQQAFWPLLAVHFVDVQNVKLGVKTDAVRRVARLNGALQLIGRTPSISLDSREHIDLDHC